MKKTRFLLFLCCLFAVCLGMFALAACAKKQDTSYDDGDYIVDSSEVEWEEQVDGSTVRRYKDDSYEIIYLSGNRSYITLEGSKLSEMAVTGYKGDVLSFSLADLESIEVSGEAVSVNEIKEDAFSGCVSLESADLTKKNASLDFTVGNNAFFGCKNLEQLTLPTGGENGVYTNGNTIGDYAFAGTALTSFSMDDTYASLGAGALQNCASLSLVELPETVTVINDSTFEGCASLTSFRFPTMVTSIGNRAFSGTQISSFDLSSMPALQTVGNYAFANNAALTSLIVPDTVTSLGKGVFSNDVNFRSLTIARYSYDAAQPGNPLQPADILTGNIASLFGGDSRAEGFYSADGVAVPETFASLNVGGMQSVPDSFAAGLRSLESVSLSLESGLLTGEEVAIIGNSAFRGCELLGEQLSIKGIYRAIGEYAFADTALTAFTVPEEVYYLGDHAFEGTSLTSFDVPESVIYLGEGLFYNVEGLSSLRIGQAYYYDTDTHAYLQTVSSVAALFGADPLATWLAEHPAQGEEDYPFYTAYNKAVPEAFSTLTVGKMLTVPDSFLRGMSSLSDVSITLDSRTAALAEITCGIGAYAFDGCTRLGDDLSLTGTYTFVGSRAFAETAITRFTLSDSVTYVGEGAFYGTENFSSLTVEQNDRYDTSSRSVKRLVGSVKDLFGADSLAEWLAEHPAQDEDDYPFYTAYDKAVPETLTTLMIGGMMTVPASFLRGMRSLTDVSLTLDAEAAVRANVTCEIGSYAFEGCNSLGSRLLIDGTYTSVGTRAFAETAITSFTVPSSLTRLADEVFYGTEDLFELTIEENSYFDDNNGNYYTLVDRLSDLFGADSLSVWLAEHPAQDEGDYPFYTAYDKAVPEALTSVTIGGMLTVPDSFLRGMRSLTEASLSVNNDRADAAGVVPEIGSYAFAGCTGLGDSMTVDGDYESIGTRAFAETAITRFTVPASVSSVEQGAFYDVPTLVSLTVESYSSYDGYSYQNAFGSLGSLFGTSETLSGWLNEHPSSSEEDYPYYTDTNGNTLPKSLTELVLGNIAYLPTEFAQGASFLCEVSLGFDVNDYSSYNDIGAYAFEGCTSLETLTLSGDYLYSIGNYAFANTALTDFVLPASVTSIGSGILSGTCLASLTVGSVSGYNSTAGILLLFGTSVPDSENADAFYTVTYNSSRYYIPASLTSLTLQNVYGIPERYAYGLASLTEADITTTAAGSIGDYAFAGCTSLVSFAVDGEFTQIGNYAFANCTALSEFTLPDGLVTIGEYAFSECNSLTVTTLPESVTSVGEGAFEGCILPDAEDGLTLLGDWLVGYSGKDVIVLPAGVTKVADNVLTSSSAPDIIYTLGTEEEWWALRQYLPSSLQSIAPVYLTAENYTAADGVGYLLQTSEADGVPVSGAYVINVDAALSAAEIKQSVVIGETPYPVVGIADRALRSEALAVLVVLDNVLLTQENCGENLYLNGLEVYSTGPQENWMLGSALPSPYEYAFANTYVTYTFYDSDRESVLATQEAAFATAPSVKKEGFALVGWRDANGYAVTFPYLSTSEEDRTFYAEWEEITTAVTYEDVIYSNTSSGSSNSKKWTVSPSATGLLVTDLTLSDPDDNCNAVFTITARCAMEITFTYSASIQESASYDYLEITHNGSQLAKNNKISATPATVTMAEGDTLSFRFHTDVSNSQPTDTATISDISYVRIR